MISNRFKKASKILINIIAKNLWMIKIKESMTLMISNTILN